MGKAESEPGEGYPSASATAQQPKAQGPPYLLRAKTPTKGKSVDAGEGNTGRSHCRTARNQGKVHLEIWREIKSNDSETSGTLLV